MPTITLKISRAKCLEMHQCIFAMDKEGSYKAAREQFRKLLIMAWPELADASIVTPPDMLRGVEFNPKHQRAMAEGIIRLCNDEKTDGNNFAALLSLAELLRVSPMVEHYLKADEVPDYDFPLSGEAGLAPSKERW